ncbi:hypothetical protein [Caviibacter abscessus]|uniref:hypothetical protein n=1 Tax=Caviibacter abscessus TaxID=1766719 RepID=UPI00082C43DD|nr:hypothetical protein [Caviibacter abscessus]
MNKKMYLMIFGIIVLNSCSSFNSMFSTYDPYEGKVPKRLRKVQESQNKKNEPEKKEIKQVQEVKTQQPEKIEQQLNDKVVNIEEVVYTANEKKILKAFKEEYSLIDTVENIEKQTTAAIIKLRKEKRKDLKSLEFLIAVNETLKKTKINSYILAVSRTINTYNSWSKK